MNAAAIRATAITATVFAVAIIATTLVAQQPAGQAPAPPPEALGTVRGHVLRADGRPLPRARVRLVPTVTTPGAARIIETDLDGSFQVAGLVRGQYMLSASKQGFLGLQFGQRRPFEPGPPITLGAGETRINADIVLPRPSAIVGRIVDENGDPVQGASVRALRWQFAGGQRRLVNAPGAAARLTDDRGVYRVYGLQPGRYVVSAVVGQILFPGPPVTDLPGYAATYFPGTSNAGTARIVTVDVSQDAAGVDFALFPARTAKVSGKAFNSAGNPVTGGILLSPSQRSGVVAAQSGARIRQDGAFEFDNVAPGEYVLQAYRGRTNQSTEGEFGSQFVTVNGADVAGLELRTTPGSTINGRVTFIDGGGAPAGGSRAPNPEEIEIVPASLDLDLSPVNAGAPVRAAIGRDWTFRLSGLSGPRRLRLARAPAGWALKAIYVNGADVTDRSLTFAGKDTSLTDVEVVLTSAVTEITGHVTDTGGAPTDSYTLIAFSSSPELWRPPSRFLASARPQQDGTFSITGLPPGEYHMAALDWTQGNDWQDPQLLESLAPRALTVTLSEGQRLTVTPQLIVR